jgi:VCBS repeat-containing protein
VLSTFSDGVWTASGPVSDVNALLAGVTYTPRTNLSSSFIISTSVTDGIDPALTGIKTITGIAVNDIPVITNTTAALAGWLTEASTLADGSVIPGTSSVSGTPAASDADPGATQTWSILPGGPSTYGSISIDPASGVWIYHLDNARPATQGLKSNETVTQIYSARITDDSSAYIDQTITVSINGSNDAPVISLDFADSNSASLSETNVTLSASGSLSIADSDRGDIVNTEHTLIVSGTSNRSDPAAPTDAELLSMLTLTDNPSLDGTKQSGTLLWSFDSNIASPRDTTFNYLGFGETLILTYTITATDDGSPALSDSENLTITISGSNETPLITAGSNTTTLAQAAANLTTSGSVTVIDADTPDTVSASVVSVDLSGSFSSSGSTLPSSLSANSNQALLNMLTLSNPAPGSAMAADQAAGGSRFDWTFTTGSNGDAAFDFLREGETLVLTYTLDLTDNSGDAATQTSTTTVAITLTGTNESPLISDGADSASLSETNASISSSGSITVTDIDLSDTITATVDAVAISGGSYTTRSGYNRSNDIPLTDAELKAMLALSVSSATTSTIPANPPNGSDVTWSFTSGASGSGPVGGNKDFEFLAAGESIQLTYTVLVQDNAPISSGQNAKTDSTTVVVTITGTNDTPDITVVDVSGAVTEDTSTTAAGNAIAQVSTLTLSGLYESGDALTASVNGVEVTYTVQAADVDSSDPAVTRQTVASRLADAINSNANLGDFITAMAAGSVLSISSDIPGRAFTLMTSAAAAAGGSDDTQAASMTAQTANASGQQLRDSGSISFTDRDLTDLSHVSLTFISSTASTGASLSAALDAALRDLSNSFTISGPGVSGAAADGSISWSFGIDNALSQYLGANQSITAIYRISISDDSGFAAVSGNDAISTASQDVTITITGANDGPMISLQTGNSDVDVISETDAGLNRTGSLTVSDVDLTNTVSVSVQGVNATGGINGLTSTNAQLLAMLSLNPAASSAVLEKNEVVDQLNWSFDSGAEAFNHLAYGEKLHLTYTLRATDSSGASFDKTLGFTISGSNDLPSITITTADTATGALTEGDSPLTSNGTLSVADKDFSNIVSASVVSVQKAGITNGLAADDTALKAMLTASPTTVISSNNTAGTLAWSFNSGIEYFNHLGAGEQMTLTYTVRVSDSSGGTADQAIQLTITGSNDAPQLTIAPVAATEAVSAATQDLSISGTLSILDKDQGSIDVTPFVAPVPMRAVGVIRPPSIAGGLPGA